MKVDNALEGPFSVNNRQDGDLVGFHQVEGVVHGRFRNHRARGRGHDFIHMGRIHIYFFYQHSPDIAIGDDADQPVVIHGDQRDAQSTGFHAMEGIDHRGAG